jgi:hypothetical protein
MLVLRRMKSIVLVGVIICLYWCHDTRRVTGHQYIIRVLGTIHYHFRSRSRKEMVSVVPHFHFQVVVERKWSVCGTNTKPSASS